MTTFTTAIEAEEGGQVNTQLLGYRSVMDKFKENTTAHGIPHVKNAEGWCKVTYWLILSLASCGGLGYNSYLLFDKFLAFNTTTSVSINSANNLTYPAVTFCNQNSIMQMKLAQIPELVALKNSFSPSGRRKRDVSETRVKRQTSSGFGNRQSSSGQSVNEMYDFQQQMIDLIADLPAANQTDMGHQLADMIVDCSFNGYSCNITAEFDHHYDSVYGNCYTYNWGKRGQTLTVSTRPGASHGLSVVFNADQDQYVGYMTEAAGLRVVVHEQDTMPFPEDEGLSASPGSLTMIGVRKMSVKRLDYSGGFKYGDCINAAKDFTNNVYAEHYNVEYSVKACDATCYQRNLIKDCGCGTSAIPLYGQAFGTTSSTAATACKSTNDTQLACEDRLFDLWNTGGLGCSCNNPCEDKLFLTSLSMAMWPSDHYQLNLFNYLPKTPALIALQNSSDADKFKRNLGKIIVYYEEFNYEYIEESVAYELFSLISDMGGILGLYIGFSLLTIFEFLEFFYDLTFVLIVGCMSKRKQKQRILAKCPDNVNHAKCALPPGYENIKENSTLSTVG